MNRKHGLAVALMLGAAAAAGTFALARTTAVSAGSASSVAVSDTTIARLNRELDRNEAALRKALDSRPPALPAAPVATSAAAAPQEQIIYVRPDPVPAPSAASGEDDEHEAGFESDEGVEFDD
jgi:hypothetical protein